MYNDARAVTESQLIANIAPTQSAAHGVSSGLSKALYQLKYKQLPSNSKLLHQADWINFNLGAPLGISDENNALKTGYDPISRCWPDWIDSLIKREQLPKVVPIATVIGQLSPTLCAKFKLLTAPDIVAGTTDSVAAFIATGANKIGDAVTSLGSTLVVKQLTDHALFVPEQGIYSHRLGEQWLVGGASNSGGAVLKYYFNSQQLQQLSKQIDLNTTPPEYYPLLSKGERFPVHDLQLQPKLTPRPDDDAQFLYGLLNGIANIEKQSYHCLQQAGTAKLISVRTVGGGAKNTIWQAIRQQKLAVPIVSTTQIDAAYGSALVSMKTMD